MLHKGTSSYGEYARAVEGKSNEPTGIMTLKTSVVTHLGGSTLSESSTEDKPEPIGEEESHHRLY